MLRCAVAEEQALTGKRHAEPQPFRHRPGTIRQSRPRGRFVRIRSGNDTQHRRRIVDRQRKQRDAIERAAGRHHARVRDEPAARLQADDVGEGGRYAPRSGGIRAERKRHEPGTDRQRRAGAGAAGDEFRIKQIPPDAVGVRLGPDQPVASSIEVGLADDERTSSRSLAGHRRRLCSGDSYRPDQAAVVAGRSPWMLLDGRPECRRAATMFCRLLRYARASARRLRLIPRARSRTTGSSCARIRASLRATMSSGLAAPLRSASRFRRPSPADGGSVLARERARTAFAGPFCAEYGAFPMGMASTARGRLESTLSVASAPARGLCSFGFSVTSRST